MTSLLTDKVAILTGSDRNGQEIAAQLLKQSIAKIYLLASHDTGTAWLEKHGLKRDVAKRVELLPCDLSDIMAVKKVADELVRKLHRLDILLLNADIPAAEGCTLSPQSIESTFAVNVLSHFVLTQILFQTIEDSAEKYGDARIVVASSPLHIGCQELNFDLLKSPSPVKPSEALDSCWRYARSKLGTILFTRELAHRLDNHGATNIYANTFFPGKTFTHDKDALKELFSDIPGVSWKVLFDAVEKSPEDGVSMAIYLATSEEVRAKELKVRYFVPIGDEGESTKMASDKDLARNLWYWCDNQVTQVLGKRWEDVYDGE